MFILCKTRLIRTMSDGGETKSVLERGSHPNSVFMSTWFWLCFPHCKLILARIHVFKFNPRNEMTEAGREGGRQGGRERFLVHLNIIFAKHYNMGPGSFKGISFLTGPRS